MKKILVSLLAIAVATIGTFGTVAYAANEVDVWDGTVDTTWYDESKDVFTITTAEQFAGLAFLVNGVQSDNPAVNTYETADFGYYTGKSATPKNYTVESVDFEGVTIKLDSDLDLRAYYANGEPVVLKGGEQLSMMPVGYSTYTPFKGTFDGQGHTIENLFQGGWDMYGYSDSSDGVYLGLFGCVEDATIKNLVIDNFSFNCEMILGGVAGKSGGESTFDNITIRNSTIATGGGWWVGGLIGWAYGNQTISNIDIDDSNTLAQVGGHYDTAVGGIIGGCDNVGGESIKFENCKVSCVLDVYNDCTANYDTGVYRNCGMVIGGIGETEEKEIDGALYPDMEAKGITFNNVKVNIGEWANYTYCWSYSLTNNCQRVEPGVGYKGVDFSKAGDYSITSRPFDAILGAENAGNLNNVRGPVNVDVMEFLKIEGIAVKDEAIEARSEAVIRDPKNSTYDDYYATLEQAVAVAESGDTIEIINDVEVDKTIIIPAAQTYAGERFVLTIDGNGNTIKGLDAVSPEIYGVTPLEFVNADVTLIDVNVEGGSTAYEFSNTLGSAVKLTNSKLIAKDTTLSTGNAETTNVVSMPVIMMTDIESTVSLEDVTLYQAPSTYAAASIVAISESNGDLPSLNEVDGTKPVEIAGTITIAPGSRKLQDVPVVIPEGKEIEFVGAYSVEYISDTLYVQFQKADVDNGVDTDEYTDLYNIVILGNEQFINRLNSADLTFKLDSTAANDRAAKPIYEIIAVDPINVTTDAANANRYMFSFDGVTKPDQTALADTGIIIGQVKISGYGSYELYVDGSVNENIVNTAETADNIVENFYVGGKSEGDGDLVLGVDLDATDDLEETAKGEIVVPTRKLTINIDFPNAVIDNAYDYQDMLVVISGEDLADDIEYKLGTDVKMKDGAYVVVCDKQLTLNTAYTVTVSGAGYRTARYTVTMTDNKVLNFWNNVKDNETAIEEGKKTAKVTYLAGDIVKDSNINIYDLSAVVSYFGETKLVGTNNAYAKYDLNRDGKIDSKDVAYVLVSWGK